MWGIYLAFCPSFFMPILLFTASIRKSSARLGARSALSRRNYFFHATNGAFSTIIIKNEESTVDASMPSLLSHCSSESVTEAFLWRPSVFIRF